jgi:hypothetical protein
MLPRLCSVLICCATVTAVAWDARGETPAAPSPTGLVAVPASLRLAGPESAEQLLVREAAADPARARDLTHAVTYRTAPEGIVRVSSTGQVTPLRDGIATIHVDHGPVTAAVPVEVGGLASPAPVSFTFDVLPILSKAGCNAGGCHGKAEGQNGFKLSVFGFDPRADHQALVMEGHGRRVFAAAPERSLLLAKGLGATPHGGGRKIEPGSRWHARMLRWIDEGARFDDTASDPLIGVAVEPARVTLAPGGTQQLRVTTISADGTSRCVTAECDFRSNNGGVADVDASGLVAATEIPGEAAILVRYRGHVATCRVTRPQASSEFVRPPEHNEIDKLVWNKLEHLGLPASALADDAAFARRSSLDVIGTLPTADEMRAFLADSDPAKRAKWIARLLDSPLYVDYWTQRWADLLQVDRDVLTPRGVVAFTRWIHGRIERNTPYDEFARSVLTAEGSTLSESPAGFFQVQKDPEKLARSVSQLFLGVRIECAQCHHHPFEKWDQRDYFAFAGFFTGVGRTPPPPNGGMKVFTVPAVDLPHPRTGEKVPAAGLGATAAEFPDGVSRRAVLARWATAPENPFFARTIANRLWAHYMGRGLVEPLDDLRATNPASNEPLLEHLAQRMVELKFDLKAFTRYLLESRVYQLASRVEGTNAADDQNHSHASWKPLPAEVLLDAVSQVTGVAETFNGWPKGRRAIQVWDNKLPSDFLAVFGRPARQTVCACERDVEPSIAQALHLLNATGTAAKLASRTGRAALLAARQDLSDDALVDELFLSTVSRLPVDAERTRLRPLLVDTPNRREAVEDILWILMNTKEFVFNH